MGKRITFVAIACSLLSLNPVYGQQSASVPAPGSGYVALGSSFAAGPGVPAPLGSCGRSDHNYAHLVASSLQLRLTDVSCNGATTDNIRHTPQGEAAPQIDAVNQNTALVTVTIGGNDINYTSSTFACSGTAPQERCTANLDRTTIDNAVSQLPGKLGATIDAVRAKAPQARIVLVTYPRVFPVDASSCGELALSAEDTAYLAALGQTLEDIFVNVAAERQILIADAYVEAVGHGPCDTPVERWVNGASVADSGIRYHPTAEGHIEMARLVLEALEADE